MGEYGGIGVFFHMGDIYGFFLIYVGGDETGFLVIGEVLLISQ